MKVACQLINEKVKQDLSGHAKFESYLTEGQAGIQVCLSSVNRKLVTDLKKKVIDVSQVHVYVQTI